MSFTSPSPAVSETSTRPAPETVTPSGAATTLKVGLVPKGQPRESMTSARNENDSPGRMSFRDGRTSRRVAGPGVRQVPLVSSLAADALGFGVSPAAGTGRKNRVLRTLAVQF